MASTTSNLGLTKPTGTDKALVSVINTNSDILDSSAGGLMDALAIVAKGNTHGAISAGQFVYVRGHNTLAEGLYTANSAIAANATLTSSNLTADSGGGLNSLNSNIANIPVIKTDSFTGTTSGSGNVSKAHAKRVIILSAWTNDSDRIVTPFAGAGAGITGQYTWWFQVFTDNSSHSVIANTSVTIYYVYIQME